MDSHHHHHHHHVRQQLVLWLLLPFVFSLSSAAYGFTSRPYRQTLPPEFLTSWHEASGEDSPNIWITLSQNGVDYLKDVVLDQVLQSSIPLSLPNVTKSVGFPFGGQMHIAITNVTLIRLVVPEPVVSLGNTSVAVRASNVQVDLTLDWRYSYSNTWLPQPLSDAGEADIQVLGMQAGVSTNIKEEGGSLQFTILQCGTYIQDLNVQLHGGSSWFYQWWMDELQDFIRVAVEEQLQEQIEGGVLKLNSLLVALPKQAQVDNISALNFTIISEPIVSPSSISIGLKGDFFSLITEEAYIEQVVKLPPGLLCSGDLKMVTIALSEFVLNSAAATYFTAGLLNWLVNKVPDQSILNTSKWKYLMPQLYKQYPNKDMSLYFEVSSPPSITATLDGLEGEVSAHMIIEVLNDEKIVPVASIAIAASVNGFTGLDGNNITGEVALDDLSLSLEWSNVGNIHLLLVEVFVRSLTKDVLVPLLNLNLRRGFPLPLVRSVELQDASIKYGEGFILVCTDVQYTGFSS